MEVKPNRTSAYRFTVTSKDDPALKALRAEISKLNEERVWEPAGLGWGRHEGLETLSGERYVVSVKGRLGKDNPRRDEVSRWAKADGAIPHWAAQHFDVYVHRRWDVRIDPNQGRTPAHPIVVPPEPEKGVSHFHAEFSEALTALIMDFDDRATLTPEYGVIYWEEVNRTIDQVLLAKLAARR